MKFLIIFSVILSSIIAGIESLNQFEKNELKEEDLVWKKSQNGKRSVWQSDAPQPAPMAPIQTGPQMGGQGQLPVPVMRNAYCDPEISSIGKRSIQQNSFPNLFSFFLNEDKSDVKLVVNGTKLPAHKFVLSAKSKKFDELFREEPLKDEYDLGENSVDEFKAILKYLYSEKFETEDQTDYRKAFAVFQMARKYGIENLMQKIELSLGQMIFTINYIEVLKFAEQNQMNELIRLWNQFVFSNSPQIMAEDSYMNETLDVTERVLTSLNAPQSYVLSQIRKLMAANPQLDVNHFRKLVFIERCSVDDLVVLNELKLFDTNYLFEDLIKRYRIMSANCQRQQPRHVGPYWIPNNQN